VERHIYQRTVVSMS